jgi:hypothetical protein
MALFEFDGLDEVAETLDMVSKAYPKEVKKFMQSEGNKLKKKTKQKASSVVNKKTGNYEKGIRRGKYYKYSGNGADSIRVYSGSPAHHGHLIEYGHEMVTHKGERTGKYVRGYHIFKSAADDFEGDYDKDCEKFSDKITEPLNN